MARSRKTTKTSKLQTYTVTLELMTPIQCTFEVKASSPSEAIGNAMRLDWDDYEMLGTHADGPTYCVIISDGAGNVLPVPRKYTAKIANKENN
jgi:hypothetical protein